MTPYSTGPSSQYNSLFLMATSHPHQIDDFRKFADCLHRLMAGGKGTFPRRYLIYISLLRWPPAVARQIQPNVTRLATYSDQATPTSQLWLGLILSQHMTNIVDWFAQNSLL
jgi:hypothetical protein